MIKEPTNPISSAIEAKIKSGEQENQIRDYRTWLEQQSADEKILATIARYRPDWSAKPDVELQWVDLVPLVQESIATAHPGGFEAMFW